MYPNSRRLILAVPVALCLFLVAIAFVTSGPIGVTLAQNENDCTCDDSNCMGNFCYDINVEVVCYDCSCYFDAPHNHWYCAGEGE